MRSPWLVLAACSYSPVAGEPDPPAPDVQVFDAARDCPADYTIVLSGESSRYRVIRTGRRAWVQADDCADDKPGFTHLVAIDSPAELDQVEATIDPIGDLDRNVVWVGGIQPRDQAGPREGWLAITGGPLIDTEWDGGEPNDGSGGEDNGENFSGVERNREGLVDFPNTNNSGALCECDGKPVDPAAAAAIDANRQ